MNLKDIDHLLTTTRSVRKRLDLTRPVEREVIEECLELAIQSPTGSNRQTWHFVIVTDSDKRAKIAQYYRDSFLPYAQAASKQLEQAPPEDIRAQQLKRVRASSTYLAENMQHVPVLIICCIEDRPDDPSPRTQAGHYGSILPAAWSLMLALRSRGLGSAWTTLHLKYEKEVAELIGIPDEVIQTVLLPVAYYTGDDFKPAKREPATEKTHWDTWGNKS